VGKFQRGHQKLGGRRRGGSQAQLNLKAAILGALEAVDGVEFWSTLQRRTRARSAHY